MRCLWCHKDVDPGWTLCPDCGGELVPDLTTGGTLPTYRPVGAKPFDPFVLASIRRMTAKGPLVVLGVDGRIEANLVPYRGAVVCRDLDGSLLFSLKRYLPVDGAVVAFTGDDEPLATFLPEGVDMAVRDGTSAPVATLRREPGTTDDYNLMETGGKQRLASVWRQEYELGDALDDQWTLLPTESHLPIAAPALVALVVVCAARFARPPRAATDGSPHLTAPLLDLLR
ncbi:MAG TPA: hypothetical protein VG076_15145 [Acidimicrobiales bacterium]|nr:hypothetical protein [Acidimicrobiales bacterium]